MAQIKNWVKLRYDNTAAQAAIIYLYVVGLVMGVALYIYMSPIMDGFTAFHTNATEGVNATLPISRNLQDSIFITQLAFRDWPIVYFVLLTIAAYAAALKYRSSQA
jgi:ABC-type lipoprotein release transport system permease subunit